MVILLTTVEKKMGLLFGVCNFAVCSYIPLFSLSGGGGGVKNVCFYSSDTSHSRPLRLAPALHGANFTLSHFFAPDTQHHTLTETG